MNSRHAAGFGKRIEFWIIGEMIKEGLDVRDQGLVSCSITRG